MENVNLRANRRMEFRIVVNSGDVIVEGEQIYGDGVNIAPGLDRERGTMRSRMMFAIVGYSFNIA